NLRDPNHAFDTAWYFAAYPDVRRECVALEDFVNRGAKQGCRPFRDFDYSFYRERAGLTGTSNLDVYYHYLTYGRPLVIPTCAAPATVKMRLDNPSIAAGLGLETSKDFRKQAREPRIAPVWGLPVDAEICALKAPSFDKEVALFVAYSPDGKLKPHVP